MATAARIDVGMPTRGGSPWLAEAVESVLAQTYADWRLVVSENGPGTPELRRELAPFLEEGRIEHVTTGRDLGAAGNHTFLLERATAPYVTFLHDDDRWEPRFLERRLAFLEEHPECALVFGRYATIDEAGRPLAASPARFAGGVHRPEETVPVYIDHTPIGMPTLLIRRSAFDAVGTDFRADTSWMDLEMWFRLVARFPIGFLDVVDSGWRRHPRQTTTSVRLWGESMANMLAGFERTLRAVPELDVDLTRFRRKYGEELLQAGLDALEDDDRARSAARLAAALEQDPRLRRDPAAVALRAALRLGTPGVRGLRALRRLSWAYHRRRSPYG